MRLAPHRFLPLLPALGLLAAADDALPPAPGFQPAGIAAPEVSAVVTDAATESAEPEQLSEGEARIRAGIVLQNNLLTILARVRDHDSAEAAVAPVMRLIGDFQAWAQGFAALPPLDDETRMLYEERYMPVIHELNERLRAQGERIASAEFYGSADLPAALARLVTSMQ